jgi:hypothetical protein
MDKIKNMSKLLKIKASEKAKEKGLILVDWNKLSEQQKITVKKNLKIFFVMFDIKLPKFDDIRGLPEFKEQLWKTKNN